MESNGMVLGDQEDDALASLRRFTYTALLNEGDRRPAKIYSSNMRSM